ncbi:hypothetical protein [Bdellovibrio sp. HCB-110]|uniref:hypothetical protein n=1 Tax=Bdellovibrio sp. HCB-110 TaxID=3391182 RepID=UPI0039B4DA12
MTVTVKFSYLLVLCGLIFGNAHFAQAEDYPKGGLIFNSVGMNFQRLLELCIREPQTCELTAAESKLLQKIYDNYLEDAEGGLGVVDPKDNPGFFDLDPQSSHRFARTGDQVGDMIYVNYDQLDKVNFFTAIAILVHEFGHHHGVKDTKDRPLDVLGSKVATAIRKKTQIIDLSAFNQPHIKFYVINFFDDLSRVVLDGTDADRRRGTLVFKEDGEFFKSVHEELEPNLVCPTSVPVRGPIWINNLRPEDLFDWSERKQAQGFALRANMQMVCHKEGEKQADYKVLSLALRYGFYLEPLSGPAVPNWWKSQAGRISDYPTQNTMIQEGVSNVDNFFRSAANRPVIVKNFKYSKDTYQAGETVSASGEFESSQDFDANSCKAFLTSPQFMSYVELPRHRIIVDCSLSKVGAQKYSVTVQWKTPSPTVERSFYLDYIYLTDATSKIKYTALPDRRVYFDLRSAPISNPMQIHSVSMMGKTAADKKATPFNVNLDVTQSFSYNFKREDYAGVLINILNPKELLPVSRIEFQSDWQHPQYGRIPNSVFMASATQATGMQYQVPFNFNNQVVPNPAFTGVSWVYVLRGAAFTEQGAYVGNPANSHQFARFYLINKNLEEITSDLDITIVYK